MRDSPLRGHVHTAPGRMQGESEGRPAAAAPGSGAISGDGEGRRRCGRLPGVLGQVLRVRTKFWPVALVQFSWFVETSRQLKLIGDWRISEVPVIWTEVAPVSV